MRHAAALCGLILLTCSLANAADWQNWRGPSFNGSTDQKNLPDKFSKTENVAWYADLPGLGSATPIISGDHVFMSSTDKEFERIRNE
ncbi:MAG: hypothetical protein MI757_15645, partial [Pirellulales bacterium]|nr:hypothetical protein [Pirellulales bacterium]